MIIKIFLAHFYESFNLIYKVGRWLTTKGSILAALTEIWIGKTSPYKEELSKL